MRELSLHRGCVGLELITRMQNPYGAVKLIKGRHSNLFAAVNDFVKQIEEDTLC